MKERVALRVLSEIMKWDDTRAREEFGWLSLMSRVKYDGYRDFLAGVRFIESLADWLQQFTPEHRETAFSFIKERLVYVGPAEMQHLVELLYPETVRRRLTAALAQASGTPAHMLWAKNDSISLFRRLLRKTIFLGLSDGARMDGFRRANAGIITNEQVVVSPNLDKDKWNSLLTDLRNDVNDAQAKFDFIYLIDDFVGSGKTLLRYENQRWTGKLFKFRTHIEEIINTHLSPDFSVCVHHYIASHNAYESISQRCAEAKAALGEKWFSRLELTYGTVLPNDLPIDPAKSPDFCKLIDLYYNSAIQSKHTDVGGTNDVRMGFGNCRLPLVIEHNTPNNSIALLWADTSNANGQHAMRPLFRRRQRHA